MKKQVKKLTMILMRHGKAERDADSDHKRGLTDRGVDQSRSAGKILRDLFGSVDKAIVSDATRTRQTVAQVMNELPIKNTIFEAKLYSAENLRGFVECVTPHISQNDTLILIVGHNPTISLLVSTYTDEQYDMGTGEYVVMTTEATDWSVALESAGCWDPQNN